MSCSDETTALVGQLTIQTNTRPLGKLQTVIAYCAKTLAKLVEGAG